MQMSDSDIDGGLEHVVAPARKSLEDAPTILLLDPLSFVFSFHRLVVGKRHPLHAPEYTKNISTKSKEEKNEGCYSISLVRAEGDSVQHLSSCRPNTKPVVGHEMDYPIVVFCVVFSLSKYREVQRESCYR